MNASDHRPEFQLEPKVLQFAAARGIEEAEVLDMVVRAAKVTHKLGNRRYHQFLFMVQEGVVSLMTALEFDNAEAEWYSENSHLQPSEGEFLVYEECRKCEGEGCKRCGNTGQIRVIRRENDQLYKSKESKSDRNSPASRFRLP